jgi:hypothetical protein
MLVTLNEFSGLTPHPNFEAIKVNLLLLICAKKELFNPIMFSWWTQE